MKNKILINILLIIGIIVFSNTLVKAEDKLDNVDMTLDKISIIGDTTTFSEKDKIYLNIKANEEIKEMFLEIVDDTNDNVFNAQVLDVNNEPYIDLSKLELAEGQYSVNMVTLTSKYISSYKIYSKENNEQIITEDLKDDIKFSVVKNNSKNENAITENTTKIK